MVTNLVEEYQYEESKYLTIDEIMPTWSAYIDLLVYDVRTANSFKGKNNLSFLQANRCCVGESWKWKDDYTNEKFCVTCDGFSFGREDIIGVEGFGSIISGVEYEKIGKNWRETPTVKAFVKHFNEAHVKR